MTEKPRISRLKFWLIFGAINAAVYVAGHFILTGMICKPPADASEFCAKAMELWPLALVFPAVFVVFHRWQIAAREINEYRAQRNKWGNWKPPR